MSQKKHLRSLILCCFILLSFVNPLRLCAQTGDWYVWVKTSPCSGRNDWISVAKQNPGTGGTGYFTQANLVFPGSGCSRGCTFAEASSVAASLKPSSEFFKYCCHDYSVWKNNQSGAYTVVQGKFGTAGFGWSIVKGDLCCEEAETLAGIPGACSGSTNVSNTKCWPGSYAAYNNQTQRIECFCNPGLVWNNTKTACIDPNGPGTADCSGYPGSYAAYNQQTKRMECFCPEGKQWNESKTACVEKITGVTCYPGSYAAFNPQTNRTECFCNPGLVWNSTRTACIDPKDQVSTADCSGYPGSVAVWNAQTQRVECNCPAGKEWNASRTACVDKTTGVQCWPGSYAAFNPQTNRTECFCNPGLVWNSSKTACIDPKDQVSTADCSGYPGSVAVWNAQNQRVECNCPAGKKWNASRTACEDENGNNNGNNGNNNGNGNGSTWTLVSTTTFPQNDKAWKVSSGSAHLDVYNGDKADFTWSPPPGQITDAGFNVSLNVTGSPAPNSRISALICVEGDGLSSGAENKCANATAPTVPSASQSVYFKPEQAYSELEVKISLMWGGAGVTYKYKKN